MSLDAVRPLALSAAAAPAAAEPAPAAAPPAVLRLAGIGKRFGTLVANDDIHLTLAAGEVLALLGENGAGKTTLMNILFGQYLADAGSIEAFGRPLKPGSTPAAIAAGIGMVHQHFTLADNLSVLDNVILGTEPLWRGLSRRRAARARLAELAGRFGLAVAADARIAELSVGERQRVEILKALYRDARILVMDEPTAVLTPQEVDGLFATLRQLVARGLSVIFISHKLREAMAIADRVAVLRAGRLVAERRVGETDRAELAELMVGRTVGRPVRAALPPGETVLRLAGVSVEGRDGRALLDGVHLQVRRHEVVGLAGVSGNGQATLSALLSGLVQPTAGRLELAGRPLARTSPGAMCERNVARIPEDRHADGLLVDMTVWENLMAERYRTAEFARAGVLRVGHARAAAAATIAAFDVRGARPETTVRLLSGGNMQKLILGRTLARAPDFILADQPTRGLDVGAIAEVHRRLLAAREAGAGILLISEDLDELLELADTVCVIYQGRISAPVPRERVDVRELGLAMAGQMRRAH